MINYSQKYPRLLMNDLGSHFQKYPEIAVVLGARQTGKTTLVRSLFPEAEYLLADNEPVRRLLERYDIGAYKAAIGAGVESVIFDEIQRISDPGRALKIMRDLWPELKIIVTGSSSFQIRNRTGESLAGRKIEYRLFPLTFEERLVQLGLRQDFGMGFLDRLLHPGQEPAPLFDLEAQTEQVLRYGSYPAMMEKPGDTRYLRNLADSVVFKDIIDLAMIENKRLAENLLKLLAFQIGGLVNYSELANALKADARTVKRYIDIFVENYILFTLQPWATNPRSELAKTPKIYFWDLGIRNALIGNFDPPGARADTGALFENFIIAEALKDNEYRQAGYEFRYWRTTAGSEVDLVLLRNGAVFGTEIKWRPKKSGAAFRNRHSDAGFRVVSACDYYA